MTAPKRITRILKRRREPGEIATPIVAIRNQCLECCGYQPGEVELCTAPKCWLWPYRLGCKPEAAARRGKNVGLERTEKGASATLRKKSGGPAPVIPTATAAGAVRKQAGCRDTKTAREDTLPDKDGVS